MEITEEKLNEILTSLNMTLDALIERNSVMTGFLYLEKYKLEKS